MPHADAISADVLLPIIDGGMGRGVAAEIFNGDTNTRSGHNIAQNTDPGILADSDRFAEIPKIVVDEILEIRLFAFLAPP